MRRQWPIWAFLAITLILTGTGTAQVGDMNRPFTKEFDKEEIGGKLPKAADGKPSRGVEFVVLPIPISEPATGVGLALAGVGLYKFGANDRTSLTGVGGFATSNRSWGAGVLQKSYFGGDRFRIDVTGGIASLNYNFYGIGEALGERGVSFPLSTDALFFIPKAYIRVAPNLYAGVQFRLLNTSTSLRDGDFLDGLIPGLSRAELEITSGAIGPLIEFDTRDDQFYPTKGILVNFSSYFARGFILSEFDYQKFNIDYNQYWTLNERLVLAGRLAACAATGDVPFFEQCQFGASNDLRGYEIGRFRDRRKLAGQLELRWRLTDRFALVAFGGVGAVAPKFDKFRSDGLLPSGGVGLRYQPSSKHRLNLSLDVAAGRERVAVYVRIGEAY